jgi:ABC-type transport system involved in multi-copper enzyme maturation permease subunit
LGLTLVAAALEGLDFSGGPGGLLGDLAFGGLHLGGTLLAVLLPAGLYYAGVEGGELALWRMRGVPRWAWLASRWLAVLVVLAWLALAAGAVLVGLLLARGLTPAWPELARTAALAGARLAVVASLAWLVCVLCRGFVLATTLGLAVALAGQLASVWAWAALHAPAGTAWVWRGLAALLPDLGRFDPALPGTGGALAYAAGWSALALGLAIGIFSRRED